MNEHMNYFEQTMDDIVFENRNKSYGAYQLRKNSERNIKAGLVLVLFLVSAFTVYSLTKKIPVKKIEHLIISTVTIDEFKIDVPETILPVQPVQQTVHQQAVENPELHIVDDSHQAEMPPANDDLKGQTISDETITGPAGPVNPITAVAAVTTSSGGSTEKKVNTFVIIADQMPEYDNLNKYLQKNIHYPKQAIDANVEGKVYVEFIVNTDGSISDTKVVRGIGFGCDEEALRAIQQMPKWKCGLQQGNPVRVKLTIPVQFSLSR